MPHEQRVTSSSGMRVSQMVTRDTLFDIGAGTVGLIVPGGSLAVTVAKLAIDQAEQRSNA